MNVCERDECENTFQAPAANTTGPKRKRYCSAQCRHKAKRAHGTVPLPKGWPKIPTMPLLESIEHLLPPEDAAGFLGRRCNIKGDSIYNALQRPEVDFDLADLILCRLHAVHLWWVEPLADLYWNAAL